VITAEKKRTDIDPEPEQIEKKVERVYDWKGFLSFVKQASPGLFTNLEHGNSTENSLVTKERIYFEIAFPEASRVFFDYLNEKETIAKLNGLLEKYVDDTTIESAIDVTSLGRDNTEDFKTVAELEEDKRMNMEREKKEKIANHSMIRHAQKIFDTKIEDIKLKD
jgi:hypothetical protein